MITKTISIISFLHVHILQQPILIPCLLLSLCGALGGILTTVGISVCYRNLNRKYFEINFSSLRCFTFWRWKWNERWRKRVSSFKVKIEFYFMHLSKWQKNLFFKHENLFYLKKEIRWGKYGLKIEWNNIAFRSNTLSTSLSIFPRVEHNWNFMAIQ